MVRIYCAVSLQVIKRALAAAWSFSIALDGGNKAVFPGTSTVESDFSVIGWEKDEYRFSLTDISLEGILHAKQGKVLSQIEAIVDKL